MQVRITPSNSTKRLLNKFKKSPEIARSAIRHGIEMGAIQFQSTAREKAPVDTTNLRGSISYSVKDYNEALIYTNVKYAPYQEYGTGIYAGNGYIYPRKAKMLAWKSKSGKMIFAKRVKGVKAKKFMQQGAEKVDSGRLVNKHIREYLKKELEA